MVNKTHLSKAEVLQDEIGQYCRSLHSHAETSFSLQEPKVYLKKVPEDPKLAAPIMIHVSAGIPLPFGTVIIHSPDISALAADYFSIHVQRNGCHGSAPQNDIDLLTAFDEDAPTTSAAVFAGIACSWL